LDVVVVATSSEASDDEIAELAAQSGVGVFRGSLDDVAGRIFGAATAFGLTNIVRVTADDLLRDTTAIELGLREHAAQNVEVTMMEGYPYGASSEIFTKDALQKVLTFASVYSNTGFLEYYFSNENNFSVNTITCPYKFCSDIRLTLDYPLDMDLFSKIFDEFGVDHLNVSVEAVTAWLSDRPQVMKINSHLTIDYDPSDFDWSLRLQE
jgi:spore coat polysaccharide biosynthesis protein SpsF (cytidylyltransferase family)